MAKNTNIYRFAAVVDAYNDEEILVQFLKNKKGGITEKDKVFGAATAYWRPFAYRTEQKCSPTELKQYALTAMYQLQQHINYIAQSFGLEESLLTRGQQLDYPALRAIDVVPPEKKDDDEVDSVAISSVRLAHDEQNDAVFSKDCVVLENDEVFSKIFPVEY